MLEKKRLDEHNVSTIIGPGTRITGEVSSKGTVRIEGEIEGSVNCEDSIVVHESGVVKAELTGGQVIISGTVEGNVFAHDRLEITNQGKVVGNITSPRISIAEGVIFEGQCTMKPPGKKQPVSKPESEKPAPQGNVEELPKQKVSGE